MLVTWLPGITTAPASTAQMRAGAMRLVARAAKTTGDTILPYAGLFTLPALRAMADQHKEVRQEASRAFASLVHILPLEPDAATPLDFTEELKQRRNDNRGFVRQLLEGARIEDHPIVYKPHDVVLRPYQAEGVAWLLFLKKFGMHGALCDDMGLGKTLQAACVLAEYTREEELPGMSLVICPPTLIGNWKLELARFYPNLTVGVVSGGVTERKACMNAIDDNPVDIVIMGYPTVASERLWVKEKSWGYCILDEGHLVRNPKTQVSQAVKNITAKHRLMLSGTPIHNSALELFNIFDFLMPGYLGDAAEFRKQYENPIKRSETTNRFKPSPAVKEAGALAMESLHRAVLLFILRRTKSQVLNDLPPKVIQDIICEMTTFQRKLYSETAAAATLESFGNLTAVEKSKQGAHTLKTISLLRRIALHPSLVLSSEEAQRNFNISDIDSFAHSGKLLALQEILEEAGIGKRLQPGSSRSRFLIFAQQQKSIDLVHKFLTTEIPGINLMRLDGSVQEMDRASIAQRFNNDSSVDAMLVSTHVGGLGLTLTGADKVVFIEHDWNPQNDLQAMDRAHRIGQTKTVFVYRLITQSSIEEQIMSKQAFKLHLANTIVSSENVSMKSMNTKRLLDAFASSGSKAKKKRQQLDNGLDPIGELKIGQKGKSSMKSYLSELAELSDEEQYQEFNFTSFLTEMKSMRSINATSNARIHAPDPAA
ncbi:hypothetical protein AAMO2058_000510000 [Amorphochlora amoebiformis]